jgi:membrane protease subunit HflC
MNKSYATWFIVAAAIFGLLLLTGPFYVVSETEQVIITQFGQPVGDPVTTAGVHFKVPFVQHVNRLEKRVLQWDGPSADMPTRDKLYIIVDAFGRWRITDPLEYFLRLRDERSALSRLDDILGSEMRNTVARHALVEIVRTSKDRQPAPDAAIALAIPGTTAAAPPPTLLPQIQFGREALEKEIATLARAKLQEFGVELLDVRFKRINYKPEVSAKIFERMISERRQIADRFRSEGGGEAARILGKKERDLKEIDSQAYQKVQAIEGKADAEATAIYASAYNKTPESREFYGYQRTLETYRTVFIRDTTMVLTTEGAFLHFLKGEAPGRPAPAPATSNSAADTPPAAHAPAR